MWDIPPVIKRGKLVDPRTNGWYMDVFGNGVCPKDFHCIYTIGTLMIDQ